MPAFAWKTGKPHNMVRITGVPAKILIRHLPNTSLDVLLPPAYLGKDNIKLIIKK
jgi:hypothetical protein